MRRLVKSSTLWMLVIVIGVSAVYALLRERDPTTGDINWWGLSVRTAVVAGLSLVVIFLCGVAMAAINRRRGQERMR